MESVSVVDRMTMYQWISSPVCCWQALFLRGSCTKGAEAVEDLAKAVISERHRLTDRKPKRSRSTQCFFIQVLCSQLPSISTLGNELYKMMSWNSSASKIFLEDADIVLNDMTFFLWCFYLELYQLHWWSPLKQLRRCATMGTSCSCGANEST